MRLTHIISAIIIICLSVGQLPAADPASAPTTVPATKARTEPSAKPATTPAAKPVAKPANSIMFQFEGIDYTDVVRRFAQMAKKPLIGDLNITGKLTFFDSEPYTYEDALDTLNIILTMQGYVLRERGRFLQLMQLSKITQDPRLKILRGLDKTQKTRPGEIVTVVLPVKYIDPTIAGKAIVKMVSSFGSISPLAKGKGLVITDRLDNIKRISKLLNALDTESLVERQLKTYQLKRASAQSVANILNKLFGAESVPSRMVYSSSSRRYVRVRSAPADVLSISYDEATNIVIVTGTSEKVALAEQMITKLDATEGTVSGEVRLFQLTNARAEEVAATINKVFAQQTSSRYRGSSYSRSSRYRTPASNTPVRVIAHAETNQILVSARVDQMANIEKLIKDLDQASPESGGFRIFPLKVADAQQLAGVIRDAVIRRDSRGRMSPTLTVSVAPRTNALIVSGPAGDIQVAAGLIEQLDGKTAKTPLEIHVVKLKAGDAEALARTLIRVFSQQQTSRRGRSTQGASSLRVGADSATNSLIIAASPGDWPAIKKILDDLKASADAGITAVTRVVPLKAAKAEELAATLSRVYATRSRRGAVRLVIAPSKRSNSLVISASQEDHQAIAALIKSMDVAATEKLDPIVMVRLESADATKLTAALKAMMPAPTRGKAEDVFITADPASKSVLIRAPQNKRKMLEEMIAKLDKAAVTGARETRIINLKFMSATSMASMISQLYSSPGETRRSRRYRAAPDDSAKVIVTAAPGDRALIVDAPKDKIERIAHLVASLDLEDKVDQVQVRTYQLAKADASEVAASLARLFAQRAPRRKGDRESAGARPVFEASVATNQLMVAATPTQFDQIDKLVQKVESTEARTTRIFQLKYAKADQVVQLLQDLLVEEAPRRRRSRGPVSKPQVRIAALASANAVVVQGPAGKIALAEQLIKTFDAKDAGTRAVIQIVKLTKAQAPSLADAINETLRGKAAARRNSPVAEDQVTVTAEPNSNSVIVRGPAKEVPAVVKMIEDLDKGGTSSTMQVRIYPLQNGEAAALANSVSRLFQDITRQMGRQRRDIKPPPFSIASDERTNSLVVSTSEAYFALVEQILKGLDKAPERPLRDVKLIWLVNADAVDVASKIDAMFKDRRGADRPVVEADLYSNALTVIAKDADLRNIEAVIAKLDEAAKDNNVQVRVIPLTSARADRMAEAIKRLYGQMTDTKIIVTDKVKPAAGNTTAPQGGSNPKGEKNPEDKNPQAEDDQEEGDEAKGNEAKGAAEKEQHITIMADKEANALIISAPRQELDNIEALISQLMLTAMEADAEFRVFKITKAEPQSIARTLTELFNPKPVTRTRGKEQVTTTPPPVITVVADARTTSLIVRAKPLDFEIIEPLIKHLDQISTVTSEVRIFTLKNTDAADVARNLKELFNIATTSTRTRAPAPAKGKKPSAQDKRAEQVKRMLEMQARGQVTKADVDSMMTISANENTNSVIVSAPADAMKLIERIVQELDQSAALSKTPVIRTYRLKHAEVAATTATLRALFVAKTTAARAKGTAGRETPVLITGDEAGKMVIISAAGEKHDLIASVISTMDEVGADSTTVRVYRIEHADASSMAVALNGAMGRGRPPTKGAPAAADSALRISADRGSNALVVRASTGDHQKVGKLIAEMDVAPTAQYPVQLIALRNADASKVAQILKNVFGARATGTGRTAAKPSALVIEADRDSSMLMVRADKDTFAKISNLARQLDAISVSGQASRTVIVLKHAQASTVAAALTQAFAPPRTRRSTGRTTTSTEDRVTVVAEPLSNSVIVTANQKNLAKVQSLLAKLDTETAGGTRREFLILRNAKATDLAGVLSKAVGGSAVGTGTGRAAQQRVVVAADAGSNALVMSGPAGELNKLVKMAMDLDQATATTVPGVYIVPLTNGEAVAVARMVRDLYNQQLQSARRARRSIEPLAVSADERANALVIAASKEMYKQVEQWVKQVEKMKPARGRLRIITLEHADPEEVNKAIQQLHGPSGSTGPSGRRNPGAPAKSGKVETTVLPRQRTILISASDEDYQNILKLAKSLDEAAAGTKRQVRVFELKHANAARVGTALNQMFRAVARKDRPEDVVSVTPIWQTSAVAVTASKEKMAEVEHLIKELDKKELSPKVEFRIYRLVNALPTKILPVLQQMVAQVRQSMPGESIGIQADQRTRSIIVTARAALFEQLEKIIKTLDTAPAFTEADVIIIPLKHADAARLAAVLNEMLRPSATAQVTPEARALQEQIRLLRVRSTLREKIPELDLTKPIKITADPAAPQGSNSLLVSSTPDNIKAMRAIVEIMDTVPLAEGVKLRLIHLSNADAVSVQQVLSDVFSQAVRLAGKPGTTAEGKAQPDTATGKALTNPLSISVDLRTNTLVLAGQEETVALAEIIVKDLDRMNGKFATDIRLFRLKHADAAKLAPVLQSVFAESAPVAGTEGVRTQVTRLRTIIDKEAKAKPGGHTTKLAKGRPALVIQADTTTNILVVAARSDVMPLIADVIKTMDVAGAGSLATIRIYPLENADASRLMEVINGLYTGPNAQLVRDEDKPTITVDTRTNALVISTSDKTFAMVSTLLKRLDAKIAIELRDIRILTLKSAEAAGLADTLQKMMDARVQRQASLGVKDAEALRMIVVPDDRTNSLIVGGSAEGFKLVKDLAEKLDGTSPALAGQIQLLPLKHGNAGTLSAILTDLFDKRYDAARTPDVKRQKPIILPDLRANLLLVAANADDSKILKTLLAKMDVELKDPAVQLVVIPMKHNDAGVLGPTITSIFTARLASMTAAGQTPVPQDRVDVVADALSNSLVISASKENLKLISDLLKKVDIEPPTETGIVRMYLLLNSDAQRVSSMLGNLVSQGLYKPGMAAAGASRALLAEREKVSIAVDTRTNVLIISASKENFAVIEQILKRIDSSKDFGVLGNVQIYTLKHADAMRLAPTLQQFFDAKRQAEITAGGAGRSLPVSIIADARTNTLLVAGSRESFKAVEVMIAKLDGEKILAATDFNVFYLKNATAAALQPTIQKLFDQRVTRDAKTDPVTIIADSRANALIVGASAADMKIAASLVAKLDVIPDKEGKTVHVFPLRKADAAQVAETILNLYKPAAGGESTVSVSVDERMNAIVVSAGKADIKRISELIKQLDSKSLTSITEIRVFPLRNADAEELAKILTDTLTTKPTPMTTVSPNRQTLLQFVTKLPGGKKLIETALQEGVLITPDRRANSLVVSAPIESIPLLNRLIKAIDSAEPRIAEIRVFPLKNADAGQMAEVLQQLFRLEAAEAAAKTVRYTLVTTRPADGKTKPAATFGSAEQYALTVTVDVRTNSLLIGGTKQYVDLAGKVIEELDSSPAQERLSQVYRLRNAQAADIEAALRNFLDQERQRLVQALGTEGMGAAQRLLEREVAVVAETATNRLLLSASPKYFKTIEGIIQELDQAPPQVLIQTLIAEVTLDDEVDVGIDWNFSRLRSVGRRFVAGTDFGIEAAIGGVQSGFGVSITAGDLTFFLRALQSQGRLEVLSRPQILASDNQEGRIDVGQRVPFITNSRITDEGATINTIEYQDVGIILTVTPRINIDGFVTLVVEPEISEIAESTIPISETVDAIIVNRRSARTTVTVQDGHTIIIGGLITTHDERREDKVPILGDIPILGLLFRATEIVKERTELLIVLTPHILLTTGDADRATSSELKRLGLIREGGGARLGKPALDLLRAVTPREPKAQTQPVILDESEGAIVPLDLLPKLRQLIRERRANRKKDYEALLKKQMELNKAKGKLEPEGKKKADK